MITFICFVLYKLNAPWWIYVLSIIGVLSELDSSDLVHRDDVIIHCGIKSIIRKKDK